jgi:hypothetical protein
VSLSWDQILTAFRSSASSGLLATILGPIGWLWLGRGQIASQLKDG